MLTILHTESSMGWGGQEIRILLESLGMLKRGKRILIAAPEKSTLYERSRRAGLPAFPADFKKKNPLSLWRMVSLIDRERVDIVNTHSSSDSWVAGTAAKLSKARPRIIRTRHLSTPIGRNLASRVIYMHIPDIVITTGEEIRRRMIEGNNFDSSRIHSVPTGVDLARFDPTKAVPVFRTTGFAVGAIGVLRSWKGHRYLLEAIPATLERIPHAHFFIVGKGPQAHSIKDMIDGLQLNHKVSLLGHREDIPDVLTSLDVIVHPSYGHEGVPQSVLQALAMEKPVVASDVGAVREVVLHRKTGILVRPKAPGEIADAVTWLYEHPDHALSLGKQGRILVLREYSLESMLDKIESLYARIMSSARGLQKDSPSDISVR